MALLVTPMRVNGPKAREGSKVVCVTCGAELVFGLPPMRLARLLDALDRVHRCIEVDAELPFGEAEPCVPATC